MKRRIFIRNGIYLLAAPAIIIPSRAANIAALLGGSPPVAGCINMVSPVFNSGWTLNNLNAFGATDTGGAGAGSFHNTSRTTDPTGGNSADYAQENSTASVQHGFSVSKTFVSGVVYTYYVYAKTDTRFGLVLLLPSARFSGGCSGKFNLNTGAGAIRSGAPTVSCVSAGSGWFKCQIIDTASADGLGSPFVYLSDGDGSNITFNGDNTSGLFLYEASLCAA